MLEICYGMEMAEGNVEWLTLVLAVLDHRVTLVTGADILSRSHVNRLFRVMTKMQLIEVRLFILSNNAT